MKALVGLLLALVVSAGPSAAAPAPSSTPAKPSIWCISATETPGEDAALRAYARAAAKLCAGDAAGARAGLAAILPAMKANHRNDGARFLEYALAYFFSLLATERYDDARRFLNYLEIQEPWTPATAERLFWKGDYAGSFAAYVADDAQVLRNPDQQAEHKLDPHLPAALQALKDGKLDAAITAMKADQDVGSLYSLMRGNLYAQKRDWPSAFAAWIDASAEGPGFAMMEYYVFDRWNISALEMLYYYRAHAPK